MSSTTGAASAPDDFTNFQNGHNDQDPATPTPGRPKKPFNQNFMMVHLNHSFKVKYFTEEVWVLFLLKASLQ